MGRPPSNGGPAFRFTQTEVADMETVLQEHHNQMPAREILESLAEKFSESTERKGRTIVQFKQVWNWFQNRRYAIRAKSSKVPGKLNVTSMPRDDSNPVRNVLQPVAAPMPPPMAAPMSTAMPATTVPVATRHMSESFMEFEAKSSRDGAWYDVATFLAHRYMETGDPEVQVRFAGFGPEEDEWVKVRKHLRQRSLPCEASECVAVLPGDLILCFQEGKDQALYFDAHVLDAQRRRHDVRGCRCRFLVRYDHDQSEEIVPLRKVCRRPETDYRLQQLHASSNTEQKPSTNPPTATTPTETMQKQQNRDVSRTPALVGVSHANVSSIAAQTANPESKNAAFTTTIATSTPAQNMQE
ncbi:protein SAWADEE HOMEODOMAIN HOMOLOG 2-like [Gossypium arboreum]|uniref:Homeobox domain-containing protein n=1 Tax=Gossypium arboreum TaxID=29729 RepID=A0ABR0QZS2_GOSAR|nr:protein SAWADEE HOMEODOMAIN HOMOLOG 2-like [Gossypium arboreum]KAK5844488.1 hypothetical protein PVK06_000628 [Gossypium arboreum]